MQPTLDIAGLTLQTFGLMFALAFLLAGALVGRRLVERGLPADWAYEMIFAAIVGGLVGARIYFIIENYASVKSDLIGNLFSGSGLVWYGGAIGGALAVFAWAAWRRTLNLELLDTASPGLAVGYAIGRIGCQLSGDGDYGIRSSLPWAMGYPHGTLPTPPGVQVQPTPIYETLAMGLVALWLWRKREHFAPGLLFASYLVASGIERLLIEFIRRNHEVLAGLTGPQLESIFAAVAGALWLTYAAKQGTLRSAASTPAAQARSG